MGLRIGLGSQTSSGRYESGARAKGDPVPEKFDITSHSQHGKFAVVVVVYPDARNYDGMKIAVYEATWLQLIMASSMDPHFKEERTALVPLARFEPTTRGWLWANHFARMLQTFTP